MSGPEVPGGGATRTAVVGIGDSHAGDLDGSPGGGDAIVCEDGVITWIGPAGEVDRDACGPAPRRPVRLLAGTERPLP